MLKFFPRYWELLNNCSNYRDQHDFNTKLWSEEKQLLETKTIRLQTELSALEKKLAQNALEQSTTDTKKIAEEMSKTKSKNDKELLKCIQIIKI